MTPQQQLAEMRKYLVSLTPHTNETGETAIGMAHELLDALEAVLDIEKKEPLPMRSIAGDSFMEGYNSALATVAEVVGEGMRG